MNTIFADRLQGDPRFKGLVRDMGDPLKAIGALYFVWSGTQALGLVEATETQLMDCFPLGYRGVKSALSALKKNGWLAETPAGWRITGNEAHVIKGKTISEKNRAAAIARWEAERMRNAMHQASGSHAVGNANAMRENARSDPMRSDPMRSDPPNPHALASGGDPNSLSTYQLEAIPLGDAREVYEAWAAELLELRRIALPPMPVRKDLEHFRKVILFAGNKHDAVTIAKAWVHCEDPKGFIKSKGWAPWLLAEEKNFDQARAMAGKMMVKSAS